MTSSENANIEEKYSKGEEPGQEPAEDDAAWTLGKSRREMLLNEYREVSNNFRLLTDIRFKLIAVIPIAAGLSASALGRARLDSLTLVVSAFGLVVTIGVLTYNARNDQLYGTLVARAAAIERALGVPDGAFANRPRAWLKFEASGRRWKVDHGTGIACIYYASLSLWLFGVIASVLNIAHVQKFGEAAPDWLGAVAGVSAAAITAIAVVGIKRRKSRVEAWLRAATRSAYEAWDTASKDGPSAVDWDDVDHKVAVFDLSYDLPPRDRKKSASEAEADARKRAHRRRSYISGAEAIELGFLPSRAVGDRAIAEQVAYLCDLAPEWVYDAATGRRGSEPWRTAEVDLPGRPGA